jgi:ArsR family transcriptional regulator, arsenate/arsenite/antimonite-responsive transcriptional repressor
MKLMKKDKAVMALAALAQESRLAIFRTLIEGDENGISAGTLSEILNIPPTTLSFHLSQLRHAGLVNSRKEGRTVIYIPNRKRAKKIAGYITGKVASTEDQFSL